MKIQVIDSNPGDSAGGAPKAKGINGSELNILRSSIIGCARAIELRDPHGLIAAFALPKDTSAKVIVEALRALKAAPGVSSEERIRILKNSPLAASLGANANLSYIFPLLSLVANSESVTKVIDLLDRL